MKKPTVGIEQDAHGERFLTIVCPDCDHVNRFPFGELAPDTRLECKCGVGFNLSARNFQDLKDNYGLIDGAN